MSDWSSTRRQSRLEADYTGCTILSDSMYNLVMGGVVIYGLLLSALICMVFMPYVDSVVQHYTLVVIAYFVSSVVGIFMTILSRNPIISFVGYNFVVIPVGIVLSVAVAAVTEYSAECVYQALFYTAIVTICMVLLSTLNPGLFLSLGGLLFAGLTGLILSGILCMFMGWNTIWQAWAGVVLFSFYVGYDFQRAQIFEKTLDNAVDCALDIYLDVVNLFLYILRIMASSKSRGRKR